MVWRNAKAVTTPTPGTLISRLVVSSPGTAAIRSEPLSWPAW